VEGSGGLFNDDGIQNQHVNPAMGGQELPNVVPHGTLLQCFSVDPPHLHAT